MIKRSFIVFLLLAAAYALFLKLVNVDWDTTQHLANGNRIKAEGYVFAPDDTSATVIVGSSLAYRIELDSLPAGTSNLGFGGLSIYDGLQLINRSGKSPARVLIESNVLFREPDKQFLNALFEPGLYELRRELPIMREHNQPSGVLYGWVKKTLLQQRDGSEQNDTVRSPNQMMLAEQRHSYAQTPADSTVQRFMRLLLDEVKALEQRGVEVVFFEVPIDRELERSQLSELSRSLISEHFPTVRFLRMSQEIVWRTTDGLHLDKPDALRFSGSLARELRDRSQDPSR